MLEFISTKFRSIGYRFELLIECRRLIRFGKILPKNYLKLIFRYPYVYDDFIQMLCFFDNNKKINLIDVGANEGHFLNDFKLFFSSSSNILCFEPNPQTFKILEENVKNISKKNEIRAYNTALGDEVGELEFLVPEHDDNLGSFYEINKFANKHYEAKKINKIKVQVKRLDDFINEINKISGEIILKIDTQGYEDKVLEGGKEFIKRSSAILLETSFASQFSGQLPKFSHCVKLLDEYNFVPIIFQEYGRKISSYAFERDILFVKRELVDKIYYENYKL